MVKKAMVMAAGVGSRLNPLTLGVPKPLITIANQPLMDIIIALLVRSGINDIVANTHYLADQIHRRYQPAKNNGFNINFVHEDKLSGTAGGLKKCEWFFRDEQTFMVISGDALTDIDIKSFIKKHKESGSIASMALKEIPFHNVNQFGVVVLDKSSRITGFQEKPALSEAKSNFVNTGIYLFEKEIFNYIPPNTFYDFGKQVFPELLKENIPISGFKIDEYWNDIGTIEQYRLSSRDAISGKIEIDFLCAKKEFGWASNSAFISKKAIIKDRTVIGEGSIIKEGAKFSGNCVIGKNCVIEENAHIKNSVIWDNVVVSRGIELDNCIVTDGVFLKRGINIAKGSVISNYALEDGLELITREEIAV